MATTTQLGMVMAFVAMGSFAGCSSTLGDGAGAAPDAGGGGTGDGAGGFGTSCDDPSDCASGMCQAGGCTVGCDPNTPSSCPNGGACISTGSDPEFPTYVCEPGDPTDPGATCDPTVDPSCPVDATCGTGPTVDYFPPYVPLVAPQVPATCDAGFEINNSYPLVYTIDSKTAAGSRAITLDVDIATYTASNWITIRGVDANGQTYVLLDTCRMRTWTAADPTSPRGHERPLDETIRQFRVDVRQGTTRLEFDFSRDECKTPFYVRAVGLCDFDTTANPWAGNTTRMPYWRAVD